MQFIESFKASCYDFKNLLRLRKQPFWKVVVYLLFLAAITAVPLAFQTNQALHSMRDDGQKIAKKVPEFTIQDGTLKTEKTDSGFVYQTNSIIFTFDPAGKRTEKDITSDATHQAFSIGFLQKEFVLAFPGQTRSDQALTQAPLIFSYKNENFDSFNSEKLKQLLSFKIPFWLQGLIFLFAIYPAFLSILIQLIMMTLLLFIFSRILQTRLRFGEVLKITAYALTIPVILSAILQFFNLQVNTFLLFFVFTLFVFYQSLKRNRTAPPSSEA